jgi:hypothetical protein
MQHEDMDSVLESAGTQLSAQAAKGAASASGAAVSSAPVIQLMSSNSAGVNPRALICCLATNDLQPQRWWQHVAMAMPQRPGYVLPLPAPAAAGCAADACILSGACCLLPMCTVLLSCCCCCSVSCSAPASSTSAF